jgi:hypothetical protein
MKTKTITVMITLVLTSICFGQAKTPPIAIDCTFYNIDLGKLHLRGFSNTKVAPEKIATMPYSRPESNADIPSPNYVILGKGFGHVTVQANRRELGTKLRKVASDHGANVIAYEISGTEFRVRFLRVTDRIFEGAASHSKDVKRSQ